MLRNLQGRLPGATVRVSDATALCALEPGCTAPQPCSPPLLAHSQAHSDVPAATVVRRLAVSHATGEGAVLPMEHLETHFVWANPTQSFLFAVPSSGQDKVTDVMLMAIGNAVIASQSEAWMWLPSGIALVPPRLCFL